MVGRHFEGWPKTDLGRGLKTLIWFLHEWAAWQPTHAMSVTRVAGAFPDVPLGVRPFHLGVSAGLPGRGPNFELAQGASGAICGVLASCRRRNGVVSVALALLSALSRQPLRSVGRHPQYKRKNCSLTTSTPPRNAVW